MKIPYFKQTTNYSCAAAVFKMILASRGIKQSERALSKVICSANPRGTYTKELVKLARKFNLECKEKSDSSISELKKLQKTHNIIILLFETPRMKTRTADDHYLILKSVAKDSIFFLDPYSGNRKMSIEKFKQVWHSDYRFEKKDRWFLAIKFA